MFREELEKILTNMTFYAALMSTILLLLLGNIYKSPYTGEEYTVFDIILSKDKEELIREADLHKLDVITGGIDSYLEMFVPVIVAIPFVMVVCGEKKNSNTRFEIYRVGKNRYLIEKYLADMVAGGLILILGYMIFSMIIGVILPDGTGILMDFRNQYLEDESIITGFILKHYGIAGLCGVKFFRMFLYGAVSVIPAFGISMIVKNRYIIISIPFMINYLLRKFVEKRSSEKLGYVMTNTLGNIYAVEMGRLLLIFGTSVILVLILCRIYLGRKCDCGEE